MVEQSEGFSLQTGNDGPVLHMVESTELGLPIPEAQTSRKKRHFTPEEDQMITKMVSEMGDNNWEAIAEAIGTRTPRQIRDRWKYFLNPNIVRAEWTPEEDQSLLYLRSQVGAKWSQLAPFFKGRSDIDIRNHWHKLMRQMNKSTRGYTPVNAETSLNEQ